MITSPIGKTRRFLILFRLSSFVLFLMSLAVLSFAAEIDVQPDKVVPPAPDTPANTGPTTPSRVLPGEPPTAKSYLIPTVEVPLFIAVLNGLDRAAYGKKDYGTDLHTTKEHFLHGPWVVDQDDFIINQIGHPYQGAMYYSFARSSGLNYWESFLYSNAGSVIWELAGETTDPSINDQVASGTGGSFVGEALYRMCNLVLENGGEHPAVWRVGAATLISPPTMLNRFVFGKRYGPVLQSREPEVFTRLQLSAGKNTKRTAPGSSGSTKKEFLEADFQLSYGLPGKPGYRYQRPFDYFDFELQSLLQSRRHYESVMMRGILFGTDYEIGNDYRGLWGLYGSFDYLSPEVYRLSTTAVSLGTTGQWWLSRHLALQGSALSGIGYGAAGTIVPTGSEADYHYGATPQQLLALRWIYGTRLMWDTTARGYYLTGTGASRAHGTEQIARINTSLAFRVYGHHALSVGYLYSTRNAYYSALPDRHQAVHAIMVSYNLLGRPNFTAVEWRDGMPD